MKSPQLIYCLIALSLLSCKRENKTPETEKETQDPTAYIDEKPDPIYAEHVRTSAFQTPPVLCDGTPKLNFHDC